MQGSKIFRNYTIKLRRAYGGCLGTKRRRRT
ncbi:MAG: stage V sporulation protein M [Clostridiales bacterium]|nr:stage V sporulation protein M [Clostridiales bacterium]